MSILENAGSLLGITKSPAVLRAEIEEEIDFHLAERAEELIREGMEPERAREHARELFGDVDSKTLDCLTEQMGARVHLHRLQWVIIGFLLVSLAGTWWTFTRAENARMAAMLAERNAAIAMLNSEQAEQKLAAESVEPAVESRGDSPGDYQARFQVAPENWRHGLETAQALFDQLWPEAAASALSEIWSELSDSHQRQVMKALYMRPAYSTSLRILHLGATDDSVEVQTSAFTGLKQYAF